MNNHVRCLLMSLPILLFALCGCSSPRSKFVLLPSPDGHVGNVTVTNKAGEIHLAKPFESIDLFYPDDRPSQPVIMTEAEFNITFKDALAAQPTAPLTFLLYFEPGTSRLTPESEKILPVIIDYIRKVHSSDISISGHTDKVGSRDVNVRISRERANEVAKLLTGMGVVAESLEVASHGMGLPLIDTPEGVPEPRNRRVELVVR
ncbi:MAG: OmpA family protein [Deltaproteobacteria bacterium]|nr:OmpA family protein [Deltaproteobacteria bacterium]